MALVTPADIFDFWFGAMDSNGLTAGADHAKWWSGGEVLDNEIKDRFEDTVKAASAGELEAWKESDDGAVAWVILLDQFTRNIYRDQARMYDDDAKAVAFVKKMIAEGRDQNLATHPRVFLYMPLMHAEDMPSQDLGVEKFGEIVGSVPAEVKPLVQNNLQFSEAHRKVVERFGRFPHRNEILGRVSTPKELKFLEEEGRGF